MTRAVGGLYCGYYLKSFLYDRHLPLEFLQLLTPDKLWYGNPLVAIWLAIAILRSARCYAPDRTMADELTTLHCLYFGDKSLIYKKTCPTVPSSTSRLQEKEKRWWVWWWVRPYWSEEARQQNRWSWNCLEHWRLGFIKIWQAYRNHGILLVGLA